MAKVVCDTVEEALADIRAGKIVLCIDDPERENEGDMICAAEQIGRASCRERVWTWV